jgi:HPt (histidine-containing phosphotransfer) domain-containing protein
VEALPASHVLDRVEGLRRVRGNGALYRELVDVFLADLPRALGTIDSASASRDMKPLNCALHALKGTAGQIGAGALAERARVMETLVAAGDWTKFEQQRRLLTQDLDRLRAALQILPEVG